MALSASRLAMLSAVAAFAALALGNGLDRASARNPNLARYVPGFLAAEAHRSTAATALQAGDKPAALAAAALAVAADPIDPRSAAVLGASQLLAGQNVLADRSFRVAARFGWRDPLTQLYFMNVALNAGQPRLAALRLDAVLRQAPDFPVRDMLLAQFEATPQGRAALAERLALRPSWTQSFMVHTTMLELPALRARAEVVGSLSANPWGCDGVAPLVERLVLAGGPLEARQLWQAHCPAAVAGIADPHFAALPTYRPPVQFEWNLIGNGDVSALPAGQTSAGSTGLLVRVSGPTARPVAWQMLALPGGQYRLNWTAQTGGDTPAVGAQVSLSCTPTGRSPVAGAALPGGKGQFVAVVTIGEGCAAPYITLWQAPGSDEVRFDDLTLTRLP
jgi:hypothetical protein